MRTPTPGTDAYTRMASHPAYDGPYYDEQQESIAASNAGHVNAFEVGGWWTSGAWGDDE